jgi:hypothetical protein
METPVFRDAMQEDAHWALSQKGTGDPKIARFYPRRRKLV